MSNSSTYDRTPYTYLIKNKSTGMLYYGVRFGRNCHPNDLWTKYFTSSKLVKDLIKRYGKEDFLFEVRKIFDTKESAIEWEQRVIRRYAIHRPDFLNLDFHQCPHMTIQSKYDTIFISDLTTKTCRRIHKAMQIPEGWVLGNCNHIVDNELLSSRRWFYDPITNTRHHVIPENAKEHWISGRAGTSNSKTLRSRNLHHITNGTENLLVEKNAIIPDGWKKGRTVSDMTRAKNAEANKKFKGTKFITNGSENKRIFPGDAIPEGWRIGHTKTRT